MVGGSSEYLCFKCKKLKQCEEGFYETNSYQNLICLQCVAAAAEIILERAQNKCNGNMRMIELLCGKSPRDVNETRTALAVFTSQRQASKCVYVRSRIGFDGCFATHYHHYSKLKKEIALNIQPFDDGKLRQIPRQSIQKTGGALSYNPTMEDAESLENESGSDLEVEDLVKQSEEKKVKQPSFKKENKGSMTAPVVSNDGVYLTRPAFNQLNEKAQKS